MQARVVRVETQPDISCPQQLTDPDTDEPPLKKWKYLAAKQRVVAPILTVPDSAQSELTKYLIEIRNSPPVTNALVFWEQRRLVYPLLAPLAEDLICAPASQAFVERIFSVCGLFTAGRRNRMEKSLEMRVFLKLNSHILSNTF